MTDHKVGTPEESLAARTELLEREKELTRRSAERHDVTMFCSSRALLEKLQAYRRRMGWHFPWVSSLRNDFNFDFDVSFTEDEQRNAVTYNYRSQDFTPVLEADSGPVEGRNEGDPPQLWMRRHDEYENAAGGAR